MNKNKENLLYLFLNQLHKKVKPLTAHSPTTPFPIHTAHNHSFAALEHSVLHAQHHKKSHTFANDFGAGLPINGYYSPIVLPANTKPIQSQQAPTWTTTENDNDDGHQAWVVSTLSLWRGLLGAGNDFYSHFYYF